MRRPPWAPTATACARAPCAPCSPPRAVQPGRRPTRRRSSGPGRSTGCSRRSRRWRRRWWRSLLFLLLSLDGARPGLGLASHEGEVLAQGIALEGLREEELHGLGMAREGDAEHLPGLALVPVR